MCEILFRNCDFILRLEPSAAVTTEPDGQLDTQKRLSLKIPPSPLPDGFCGEPKKEQMKSNTKSVGMALVIAFSALWGSVSVAQVATPFANATISGALAPGVYGRIEIGNAPPPPLLYTQPIMIQPAPVYVQQQPLYLHVPPGHAKKWSKHCSRYNACNRPVYFVKVRGDDDYERRRVMYPQAVYVDKKDWKEIRKRDKEHEKQAKKYWKKQDKHHRKHGDGDHDD